MKHYIAATIVFTIMIFIMLMTLPGCRGTNPLEGFAAQIDACRQACESRAVEKFDSCICVKKKGR